VEKNMVTAVGNLAGEGGRLILSPYAPTSRRVSVVIFSLVTGGILAVAGVCVLLGAWQVMPLSLLVVAAVGMGMRSGYRRTQIEEVVSISGETVAVEKHQLRTKEHYEFQRGWAQVVLHEPLAPMPDLSRLFIRSHGKQVEIGAFLDDEERHELAIRLRQLMGPGRSFTPCATG
jgi:uncharacterized membrane protein